MENQNLTEQDAEFMARDYVRCQRNDVTLRRVDSGICVFDWSTHSRRALGQTFVEVVQQLKLKREDYL